MIGVVDWEARHWTANRCSALWQYSQAYISLTMVETLFCLDVPRSVSLGGTGMSLLPPSFLSRAYCTLIQLDILVRYHNRLVRV